ncbi:MAG: response regulator [Symploca sp. SIO1B1]|nr:response regulator [Symploca sp. SIO1C2]NER45960.1 response regulator [Symploca sp. SIO1A3]NER94191.1 response regulator [Symploca sp. SIO1B1]
MSTVLVVEDSPTQQRMIAELLIKDGISVVVADDGLKALERVKEQNLDLVVLDIVLPKMNGYEVCRRIKSNSETQNLAVLMCSAKKEEFDRYWGMKQGADAYIVKPFQPQELLVKVRQFLAKQ